jgi:hypothetical protein
LIFVKVAFRFFGESREVLEDNSMLQHINTARLTIAMLIALSTPTSAQQSAFVFVPRADSPGNDYSRIEHFSFEECQHSCDADSACNVEKSGAGVSSVDFQELLAGLIAENEDVRRASRKALRESLRGALAAGDDLAPLKACIEAVRDAGWKLIGQAQYGDGEYTLAAAIEAVTEVIPQRPELKAWLPLLVEERLKSFMQHPAAELNDAAYSTLDLAIDRAGKL